MRTLLFVAVASVFLLIESAVPLLLTNSSELLLLFFVSFLLELTTLLLLLLLLLTEIGLATCSTLSTINGGLTLSCDGSIMLEALLFIVCVGDGGE